MKNKNKQTKDRYKEEEFLKQKKTKIALKRKKMELYEEEIDEEHDDYQEKYSYNYSYKRK